MIVPTRVQLLFAIFVVLPLCTAADLRPAWTLPSVLCLLLFIILLALDGWVGWRRLSTKRVQAPKTLRCVSAVPAELQISLMLPLAGNYQVSADFPKESTTGQPVVQLLRSEHTATLPFTPQKRGEFKISECFLETLSPTRMWSVRFSTALDTTVRVYPNLRGDQFAATLLSRRNPGLRQVRQLGKGREFERLRDYSPGDTYDDVSWKATARHGRPIVRVSQVERTQDVYVVLDASRLSARDGAIEELVRSALLLGLAAERQHDRWGLVVFSDRIETFVPPANGRVQYGAAREALLRVEARRVSPDFAELFTFLQTRIHRRALFVFLTALDDPLLSEMFARNLPILTRKHLAIVALWDRPEIHRIFGGSVPSSNQEIYRLLAGHFGWVQREATRKSLERSGVIFTVLDPRHAASQLVDVYGATRQRQLL